LSGKRGFGMPAMSNSYGGAGAVDHATQPHVLRVDATVGVPPERVTYRVEVQRRVDHLEAGLQLDGETAETSGTRATRSVPTMREGMTKKCGVTAATEMSIPRNWSCWRAGPMPSRGVRLCTHGRVSSSSAVGLSLRPEAPSSRH